MRIVEYDDVNPISVLQLNLMSLGYVLTPERVALIRQLDIRPFPFFAFYAVEEENVVGQVGVYRLPMVTTAGMEDVGGICAMCTHPAYSRQGIASRLLDEAHARMRWAGLRFSTLGTSRHRAAYALYQKQGYEDVFIPKTIFAVREKVIGDSHLRAEQAGADRWHLADTLYQRVAAGQLGFARRPKSFIPMMVKTGDVGTGEVWLLWDDDELVGYALASVSESVLSVTHILLDEGVDAATAVSALAQDVVISYVKVRVDHPAVATSLQLRGYPAAHPDWGTFMVRPLRPDVTVNDARHLFGIGTQRFMISRIDVT